MATSGTHTFTLDIADIIEEAYERIGKEVRGGYSVKTARRSLDLLLLEWQNRGLNLWTVKEGSEALVSGTASYTLDSERLDVIEGYCRIGTGANQTDYTMKRISVSDYAQLANKTTSGRPTQFWIQRAPGSITVNMWPVPDGVQTYTFGYYYMERIEDSGKPGSNTIDVPDRFLPPLVTGLAYHLASKHLDTAALVPGLKQMYEEQWTLASDSAREKAAMFLRPENCY
jgi:hypothetical protein